MNDIKGVFDKITLWCLNHDEPKQMHVVQNVEKMKSPFFVCDDNAGGKCSNRINIDDYTGVVYKFMDMMSQMAPSADLTNLSFEYRGPRHKIACKVIRYSKNDIRIGIINKSVLGKQR